MFPGATAATAPDKAAIVMASTGQVVTHRELDDRSNQLARLWREAGLVAGDHVAVFMENHTRYLEVVWAALRSGLYVTTVNSYLSAGETAYILSDCGARSVVASQATADVLQEALSAAPGVELPLVVDRGAGATGDYEEALASQPTTPLDDQPAGEFMLYSSGTTGRPKGIERPLSGGSIQDGQMISALLSNIFGVTSDSVYLSPAPTYHSAPLGFCVGVTALGGTVVMMEKFDALGALRAIEQYKVTCGQFVPTMFSRMLKLPQADRTRFDISSLRLAIHAAAPCPTGVKKAMMEWWGPILWEYYAGTELNGFCLCRPHEWLDRPGNVGRPVVGEIHIIDEDGREQPPGEVGLIYFGGGPAYTYHNDPEKTREAQDPGGHGWTTLGDVGYVDPDGWLFLTDRKAFMIISGGVNVYPQEAEDVLTMHPKVLDVAVIGVPNEEMGEEVKAVVQLTDPDAANADTESELIAYCRQRLAHYKCPVTIDFERELPRLPTGKLYKRQLRDRYWSGHASQI
jgi:long-chain acyl-CoA synthetase